VIDSFTPLKRFYEYVAGSPCYSVCDIREGRLLNFKKLEHIVVKDKVVFVVYGKWMTQALISGMAEGLEKDVEDSNVGLSTATNVLTIFVELSQNILNYAKARNIGEENKNEGLVVVQRLTDGDDGYIIYSQNIVADADQVKIEEKLKLIATLDQAGIKKKYRELRRSGKETHSKGGGLGFFEIAKRCESVDYTFVPLCEGKSFFRFKATIRQKKKSA